MTESNSRWLYYSAPAWKTDHRLLIQDWALPFREVDAGSHKWEVSLEHPRGSVLKEDDLAWEWSLQIHLKMKLDEKYILDEEVHLNNTTPRAQFVFPDEKNLDGLKVDIKIKSFDGLSIVYPPDFSIKNDLADVVLRIGNDKFHQSKTVLASKSDFFKRMFFGEFAESEEKEVELKDVEYFPFIQFLEVFHYGTWMIDSSGMAEKVLKLSSYFLCPSVARSVEDWLVQEFAPNNFEMKHLLLANEYHLQSYMKLILDDLDIKKNKHLFTKAVFEKLSPGVAAIIWKKISNLI